MTVELCFVAVVPEAFAQLATLFVTATRAYPAVPIVSSVPPPDPAVPVEASDGEVV